MYLWPKHGNGSTTWLKRDSKRLVFRRWKKGETSTSLLRYMGCGLRVLLRQVLAHSAQPPRHVSHKPILLVHPYYSFWFVSNHTTPCCTLSHKTMPHDKNTTAAPDTVVVPIFQQTRTPAPGLFTQQTPLSTPFRERTIAKWNIWFVDTPPLAANTFQRPDARWNNLLKDEAWSATTGLPWQLRPP